MNRYNWKIRSGRSDAPAGFVFGVVGAKNEVVAWVKTKADAEFIIRAASRISDLETDSSRYKRMWLGQAITSRR